MLPLDTIISIIQKNLPDLQAVYLFGSSGTAYETFESDVDIAILTQHKLDELKKWEIAQAIALIIQRNVDLVDLKTVSTIFQMEIITTGKRIYCKDMFFCDLFENTVYSAYVHFNEDRKDILEDIKKRGGQILNG